MSKIKKNSFIEGAFITYMCLMITKMMGLLYNIPFYSLIGEQGSSLYAFAYRIYELFLEISTSGIPIAISMVLSYYNTKGMYKTKEKAYKLGKKYISVIAILSFVIIQIFAGTFASFLLQETNEINYLDLEMAIRIVSFCLLVVPFLSIERGYLQGHKIIAPSSYSQVLEQIVRITFVLTGAYVCVKVLNLSSSFGVYAALIGTFASALVAFIYIKIVRKKHHALIENYDTNEVVDSNKKIIKMMFKYCATTVIISTCTIIYQTIDMKLIIVGLKQLNYSDKACLAISAAASSWIPKISMIIMTLAIGFVSSVGPYISESYAKQDFEAISQRLNQAFTTILLISLPLGFIIMFNNEAVFSIFYGYNSYGPKILIYSIILNLIGSIVNVASMATQSLSQGKRACFYIVVGIIFNTILDLPLMYLFENLNIEPYLGASLASIIAEVITLVLLFRNFSNSVHYDYKPLLKIILKLVPCLLGLVSVIVTYNYFVDVLAFNRLMMVVLLIPSSLLGIIVYAFIAYKLKLLAFLEKNRFFSRFLRK